MNEPSPTDLRVMRFLSSRKGCKLAEIAAWCFARESGKARLGMRPASAHLDRMLKRGMVMKRNGRFYPQEPPDTPSLFATVLENETT